MDSLTDYRDEEREPVNLVDTLRQHWVAIAILVAIAAAAAVAGSVLSTKKFEAEAIMQVKPLVSDNDAFVGIDVFQDSSGGTGTAVYALGRQLQSPQIVDAAKAELGQSSWTRREFLKSITVKPTTQSATVSIVAEDASAKRAAQVANTMADVTLALRGRTAQRQIAAAVTRLEARLPSAALTESRLLQSRLAELASFQGLGDPTVSVFTRAVPPEKSSSKSPVLAVVVAAMAALLVGILLALGLERLRPRLTPDDPLVRRLPVLARVPRAPGRVVRSYLSGRGTLPADLWEAYRILRANLGVEQPTADAPRSILVTSAIQGEGKTMTSVNLAIVLAAAGHRVVLVDGDLRRPMVARVFEVDHPAGFTDLLSERASVFEVLVDSGKFGDRLRLVLTGKQRPPDLLEVTRIRPAIEKLESAGDVIIIDSPALTEFADAITLARAVDAVIIAVQFGRSRRDRYREIVELLRDREITPVGVVLTGHRRARSGLRAAPQEPEEVAEAKAVESMRLQVGNPPP
jgi:succinoglycan biosynthesis transport protein ExoP